ncbi:MAG: helix-turn-helix domain-containing protein [Syntrophobacteraceae bacterium]
MSELAEHLKSERLKRGLTTAEVSKKACISIDMTESVEEGRYEQIGTSLLIRSFLRAYCSALGIDPEPILEEHDAEIRGFDKQESGIKNYGVWSKSVYGKRRFPIFPVLILIVVIAGVAYAGFRFFKAKSSDFNLSTVQIDVYPQQELPSDLPKDTVTPAETVSKNEAQAVSQQAPPAESAAEAGHQFERQEIPLPTADKEGQSSVSPAPQAILQEEKPPELSQESRIHKVEMEAVQKIWIRLVIDKKSTPSIILKKGEKREWAVEEKMQVELGDATGVNIKLDGQPIGPFGKPGQYARFTLPISKKPQKSITP